MTQTSPRPPYRSYAVLLGSFAGTLAATAGLERRLGREQRTESLLELTLLCAATFKAARVLSRERIGAVVREPVVETGERAPDGAAAREIPAGDGFRRALGELVTCTRCTGTWAAAGLLGTQAVAPRFGRLLTWTLAAGAGNDFLQAAFAALCERADARAYSRGSPGSTARRARSAASSRSGSSASLESQVPSSDW